MFSGGAGCGPTTPPVTSSSPVSAIAYSPSDAAPTLDTWIRSILPTLALDSQGRVIADTHLVDIIGESVPNNLGYRRNTVRDRVWELLNTGLLERIDAVVSRGQWRDRAHVEQAVAEVVARTTFIERPRGPELAGMAGMAGIATAYPEITLPYSLQHALLTPLVSALERLCWAWALSNTLTRYDCPEAAELPVWVDALVPSLPSLTLHSPLLSVLRNSVVHRSPLYAASLTAVLRAAESTARILGDPGLAASIASLNMTINEAVRDVVVVRQRARERVRVELERIEAEVRRVREAEKREVESEERVVVEGLRVRVGGWWMGGGREGEGGRQGERERGYRQPYVETATSTEEDEMEEGDGTDIMETFRDLECRSR